MRLYPAAIGGALGAVALAACVSDFFEDGRFTCESSPTCPPGLICASDKRCRAQEVTIADAAIDIEEPFPDSGTATPPDSCTSAAWTSQPTGRTASALAMSEDNKLYAGGSAGKRGWIAEIDTCTGGVVRELLFDVQGSTDPVVQGIALSGTDLLVSGVVTVGGASEALYARFSTKDFTRSAITTQPGAGIIGANHIAVRSDGTVFIGGAVHIFEATMTGWLIRIEKDAVKCQSFPASSITAFFRDPAGELLVVTNEADKSQRLSKTGDACTTAQFGEALVFPNGTTGGSNGITGTIEQPILVGGTGPAPGGNETGYIAVRNGSWTLFPQPDPNPQKIDHFLRAGTDGEALFVASLQNATLTGGTPLLARYALPLTPSSAPVWTTSAFGPALAPVEAVLVGPKGSDAIFLAGTELPGRTKSAIARCRKATGCAQ